MNHAALLRKHLRVWPRHLHDDTSYATIVVTHDEDGPVEPADRVVRMSRGKIENEPVRA